MRKIVISMSDNALAGGLMLFLERRGELCPEQITNPENIEEPYATCMIQNADVLIMEATRVPPFTLEYRLNTAQRIRETLPGCKIALLGDYNSNPDIVEQMKKAKKNGLIDGYFHSSVSGEYISAMLDAL